MDDNVELDLNEDVMREALSDKEDIQSNYNAPCSDDEETDSNSARINREINQEDVALVTGTNTINSPQTVGESDSGGMHSTTHQVHVIAAQLAPDSVIQSLDEAYLLYCEYARLLGFSVKKGTQSYFQKTDVVRMKMYFCSNEGRTDNRASTFKIASYKKQHTRIDCRVRHRIVREYDGPWTVSLFETEHNHELLGPDDNYFLRSSRNLSLVKRSVLETFNEAGIGVSKAFRFVQNEVGGPQNIEYIQKDAYDHLNRFRRISKLGNVDAESLMQYFQDKSANEPYFFWRVLLDDDGRLMNLFFRDSRCANDYVTFGDVLSVDTTFRTNKYNLICAPFVGMNHHRQTVMFGMGFLSDERAMSFE